MSDDVWRHRARDDEDFGPPLFGDDADADLPTEVVAAPRTDKPIVFDDSTGSLPHWTDPPTGEVPRVRRASAPEQRDPTDDLDVWSGFSAQAPVWSDDEAEPVKDPSTQYDDFSDMPRSAALSESPAPDDPFFDITDADISGAVAATRREPGRITIGTDPTDEGVGRPTPSKGRQRTSREEQARAARTGRPTGSVRTTPSTKSTAGVGGRDMPTAIAVGALMAAVFLGAIIWKPQAVLAIVVVVIGLAAVEFFEKVTEKGYQPASVVGIVACVASPLAAYWVGERAIPLVMVFAFIAGCISFIGAPNLNSSPMPNMAITTLGVTWIGLAGAYGGLILGAETSHAIPGISAHAGTDTLLLLAIGVVVNDIGALFVGSAAGRTPLRGWISPNKSVEGFIGGALLTVIAMVVIGIADKSNTWSNPNLIMLGIVIAIMAPLGDLTESMFKRNLDIKDFGSIVKGHGGVLDRFDGFLFTLPAVFYLMIVLEPWKAALGK